VTQRLIVVRHGESTWNSARRVQGQNDEAVLTEKGRAQAQAAAAQLPGDLDAAVTSDLRRTRETAALLLAGRPLDLRVDPGFRERHYGVLEEGPLEAVTPELMGVRDGVVVDPFAHPEGGESLDDFLRRVGEALERVRASGASSTLVVTHGGTVRMIRAYCAGLSLVGLNWDPVGNATVWTLDLA
jgi:broad specificity phosphatase PhoE